MAITILCWVLFSNLMDDISRMEGCAWHMWYHCKVESTIGSYKYCGDNEKIGRDHGSITTNGSYVSNKMSKIVVAMDGGLYEHCTQY